MGFVRPFGRDRGRGPRGAKLAGSPFPAGPMYKTADPDVPPSRVARMPIHADPTDGATIRIAGTDAPPPAGGDSANRRHRP